VLQVILNIEIWQTSHVSSPIVASTPTNVVSSAYKGIVEWKAINDLDVL